jgi:hypothetical protein
MRISENSPETDSSQMEFPWMLSAEGSPAKTLASLESVLEWQASGRDSGPNTPELLAKYDRDTSSWRTSQLCLDLEWALFSETWPRSGTMRNGIAFLLPTLVPITFEIESGLSDIQTPRKTVAVPTHRFSRRKPCQEEVAARSQEKPNPDYREFIMGFPIGWTVLEPSVTPSSRKSRK